MPVRSRFNAVWYENAPCGCGRGVNGMLYGITRNSLVCGLFSVLLFGGYYASLLGESFLLTLILIVGIGGIHPCIRV